ncbi:hypothetical protein V5H41_29320, partial [Salmonella enterica]
QQDGYVRRRKARRTGVNRPFGVKQEVLQIAQYMARLTVYSRTVTFAAGKRDGRASIARLG